VCDDFVSNALDIPATLRGLFWLPTDSGAHDLPNSQTQGLPNSQTQGQPNSQTHSQPHGLPLPLSPENHNRREFITSSGSGQQFGLFTTRMIRGDRYKYVWNPTDTDEFYDLEADPGEKVNLISRAGHAARIARMREALRDDLIAHGDPFAKTGWLDGQLLRGRKI
jgi:arylsulfatase A-like enzyme